MESARPLKRRKALTRATAAPVVKRRRRPLLHRHPRLTRTLAALFAVEVAFLAIAPHDRTTWAIENGLVVLLLAAWIAGAQRVALSRSATILVFAFLAIHEVGAHYTYSEVPYESWLQALGLPSPAELFDLERNHFDRAVHLLFGLMLAAPIREVLMQVRGVRGRGSHTLPVAVVVGLSVLYEAIELGYAWFAGDASANFLGAQGDRWDGTKDVVLASAGAVLAMAIQATLDLARAPAPQLQRLSPRL